MTFASAISFGAGWSSVFIEVRSSSYHRRIRASVPNTKFDRRRNTKDRLPTMPPFLPSLTAALAWGAMFPIAGPALERIDAFHMTALRYLLAASVFLALLAAVEGRRALRTDGRTPELWLLGTIGFAGFNLLTYVALGHIRPQDAALIVATAPVITVLVLWALGSGRPRGAQIALTALAFAGVATVISRGDPRAAGRLQRALGAARARRRARLDRLHARGRAALPRLLAAALHGDHVRARHRVARRDHGDRGARGRRGQPRGRRLRRRVVARALHRGPGGRRRRARVERRRQANRGRQRLAVHQPRPRRHVRDRDRPGLPAGPGGARRRRRHRRRAGRGERRVAPARRRRLARIGARTPLAATR